MPQQPNRLTPENIAAMRAAQALVAPHLPPLMAQDSDDSANDVQPPDAMAPQSNDASGEISPDQGSPTEHILEKEKASIRDMRPPLLRALRPME